MKKIKLESFPTPLLTGSLEPRFGDFFYKVEYSFSHFLIQTEYYEDEGKNTCFEFLILKGTL